MITYVALLRGINVGGHIKVPMAELRALLTNLNYQNVKAYIQSGNVIFESSQSNISAIENSIQQAIYDHFGFEISVIVKTNKALKTIFDACPFSNEKKEKSYFILLSKAPEKALIEDVRQLFFKNEEVIISNDCLYFYTSKGFGNAKFNMKTYERKLQVTGTGRNYNTMVKLLSLSSDLN